MREWEPAESKEVAVFFALAMTALFALLLFLIGMAVAIRVLWRMMQHGEGFEDSLMFVLRSIRGRLADMPAEHDDPAAR